MSLDTMVGLWTKWYGQNGRDKMVAIFGIDYNSSEINTYLFSNQKSQISAKLTEETYRGYSGSGIDQKIILSVGAGLID